MNKQVNPAAIHALTEALSLSFWYKTELRAFLSTALPNNNLIAQLDWAAYKRVIVSQLVRTMSANPKYIEDILTLMMSVAEIGDPQHLKKLDDGNKQYHAAKEAIKNLAIKTEPYRKSRQDEEEAKRRLREQQARAEMRRVITDKLSELNALFLDIIRQPPQERGYSLEKLLIEIFPLFDIDAKGSFKITGEQIDGAFTFDNTEYLLEAKWRNEKSGSSDLDSFSSKVSRKLENTLGLFLSMNGFEPTAVELHSQSGSAVILMDGADLMAVLEERITLPELLQRKRQHASRTGNIMLNAHSII